MKTLYKAKVTASGGREGHVTSDDGILDMELSALKVWVEKERKRPTPNNCLPPVILPAMEVPYS